MKQQLEKQEQTPSLLEEHREELDRRLSSYREKAMLSDELYEALLAATIRFTEKHQSRGEDAIGRVDQVVNNVIKIVGAVENYIMFEAQDLAATEFGNLPDLEQKIRNIMYPTAINYPHLLLTPAQEEMTVINDRFDSIIRHRLAIMTKTKTTLADLKQEIPDERAA